VGQTVNLLALRLQWFESTPTQAALVKDVRAIGDDLNSHRRVAE
jgi:hypothetical protein